MSLVLFIFKTKDLSPPQFPEAVCFSEFPKALLMLPCTFLLAVSVQVKATWISIWFAVCFVQYVCVILRVYILLGSRDHHLGEDHLLDIFLRFSHISKIFKPSTNGCLEASTKGLTTPTKQKKRMPFTKGSKKTAIFYRPGGSRDGLELLRFPPMIPIDWSLWGKAYLSFVNEMNEDDSCCGSLFKP